MRVIEARNVNDAYLKGRSLLMTQGIRQPSRAGDVRVLGCPVTTVYERPVERVLFCEMRDANPFFHLFECLWLLAGRNDAEFLNQFVKDFGDRFAEEDGRIYGAYGHRWRNSWDEDQLQVVIDRLRRDPFDRRSVITMWDPSQDLYNIYDTPEPRDVPCNTHIYPRIVGGRLDITVCCRSNDIIWGAYGANAVHFSFLHEYLARRIGVQIGKYYQISNNFHAYDDVLSRVAPPARTLNLYLHRPEVFPLPIGENMEDWDDDLQVFMELSEETLPNHPAPKTYSNSWFATVAHPMLQAHRLWKSGERERAYSYLRDNVAAPDWRIAGEGWMWRRLERAQR